MNEQQDPWVQLRPPATDHVTYLTFIEHNLSEETLPKLHEVLQDTELNVAIGWDLIHLLMPLVPASEECLMDIARLGNPREVVLKASEALRLLNFGNSEEESDDEAHGTAEVENFTTAESSKAGAERNAAPEAVETLPLPVVQFQALLSVLSTLHPRIKTKFPSRFLSTTLQAVLSAYAKSSSHQDELTYEVIKFVKALSGNKRPHLPPRTASSQVLSSYSEIAAPDPEAQNQPPSAEEKSMQQRLLQSFLTHILEDYMLSLNSSDGVPGMAWSVRLQEKLRSNRTVHEPGKLSFTDQFAQSEKLKPALTTVGSIVALAQDLGIHSQELYDAIVDPRPELTGAEYKEDEPPSAPKDIPLSKSGALFLLAARKAMEALYDRPNSTPTVSIFPDHATIVENFVGGASRSTVGMEPEALVDTVLFLGILALENNNMGEPASEEAFRQYLQKTSLLSADSPSPALRYQAFYLTSTVLRSHPDDLVRLSFICDTLEHCPYENLKESAVGWFKGETIEANSQNTAPQPDADNPSIFATPVALSFVSPFLFPDLRESLLIPTLSESYMQFKQELSFYTAALNFYYLLLLAKHLHEPLDVPTFIKTSNIEENYLDPLRKAIGRFRIGLQEGGELYEGSSSIHGLNELQMLDILIGRIEQSVKRLNDGL